jgi:peptidyl-tRNA hydrolase, PTH2 family
MSDKYAKQVIVVRKDLKMRKGKIAAQASHASLKVILDQMELAESNDIYEKQSLSIIHGTPLDQWINGIFTKICVSVDSEAELDAIYDSAVKAGLSCALITDVGKTEFNGVATKTCLAIGPEWSEDIDKITGDLPLL